MAPREEIRFLLNAEEVALSRVGASDMLLDYLRIHRRLTGTKEGCAEGDCGACTVLIGRLRNGALHYEPVNSCIRFLASLDGCHVVTIESLSRADGPLHPVQQAMVDHHGSQCGFCTPGIVMALHALWMENTAPTVGEIETALQGNLCRCTGYAPIIRAAQAMVSHASGEDWLSGERERVAARLAALRDGRRVVVERGGEQAILPADVDDLATVLAGHSDATIIAGATDVGLWVTKFLRPVSPAVHIGHLEALEAIAADDDAVTIGAGVSYSAFGAMLDDHFPHLVEFWSRIAGWQVRNMGTIGGNIANGSPIGDTPPALIALGATITLRHGEARRIIALEDFFIEYGKQDCTPGEFVEAIRIPRPAAGHFHAAYKISKRRDEDISSVCAAFNVRVEHGRIGAARIAFGGMAGIPKRALRAEAALIGREWCEASLEAAARHLDEDFTPLTDWRATAAYRMTAARNLFRRFYLENNGAGVPVRLSRERETA